MCGYVQIHTKKRNRLEHNRLSNLVYVSYNRRMASRFQKLREEGSKGKKSNPLLLEEFEWENEWVDINAEPVHEGADGEEPLTWAQVDEAAGATNGLGGRNFPRQARGDAPSSSQGMRLTYKRQRTIIDTTVTEASNDDDDDMGSSDDDMGTSSAASQEFRVSDELDV